MTSYNTLATARATATSMGLARVSAAADAALTAALLMAAIDIDSPGFRYQGGKYDPTGAITGTAQEHEFPRVDGAIVLAWDEETDAAVVPENVRIAEVLQAESIIAGDRAQIVQMMADGIASQTTGNVSVAFKDLADPQPLCERAMRLMRQYKLTGGSLL